MTHSLLIDRSIGRFELIRHIGRGGMGDVYLARDPQRSSRVALKLIRLSVVAMDPEILEAEKRGVELQRRLQSRVPHIAEIFDDGEQDGFYFVAMEYIEGVDLGEILQRGPLPLPRALEIGIQLCQILESIQEGAPDLEGRTVIHSDIKPENIRLEGADRVRLLDFGVAKSLSRSRKFTRNVFGSSAYLAPERLTFGRVDGYSDLWAVSVVLYQMVAGALPFQASTDEEMERRIRSGGAPDLLPPDCPIGLQQVLFKALDPTQERRYSRVALLRQDLESLRRGDPVSAAPRKASETRRTDRPGPPGLAADAGGRAPFRRLVVARPRRPSWPWILVTAMVFLIATAQGFALMESRSIERALASSPNTDLSGISARVRRIRLFDPFQWFFLDAARSLKTSLVRQAETVLEAYRSDAALAEEDWERALSAFREANDLDGADEGVLARLIFCEGQLSALSARRLSERDPASARAAWRQAADSFRRASALDRAFVEPRLALLQIYGEESSGLFDLGKLRSALAEVSRMGFKPGGREREVLLAGYLRAGIDLLAHARQVAGEERLASLYEARDALERAVGLCSEGEGRKVATPCTEARANLAAALAWLQQMHQI